MHVEDHRIFFADDITGPLETLPEATIQKMIQRKVYCSVLPITRKKLDAILAKDDWESPFMRNARLNIVNLIKAGALLLLSTDAGIQNPVTTAESKEPDIDPRTKLGEGHFNALVGFEEMGMAPMEILKSATINIARAYRHEADIGSLEVGKIADIVILDANPLTTARNYRRINRVIKDGKVIDIATLPLAPLVSNTTVDSK